MAKGGGGGTQSNEPWVAAQPYLKYIMDQGLRQYQADVGLPQAGLPQLSSQSTGPFGKVVNELGDSMTTPAPIPAAGPPQLQAYPGQVIATRPGATTLAQRSATQYATGPVLQEGISAAQQAVQQTLTGADPLGVTAQGVAPSVQQTLQQVAGTQPVAAETPEIAGPQIAREGIGATPSVEAPALTYQPGFQPTEGARTQAALDAMASGAPDYSQVGEMTDVATREALRVFNEQVLPGIRDEMISSGNFGSSRRGLAEGVAAREMGQIIADKTAGLSYKAYQDAQQRQAQAAQISSQLDLGLGQLGLGVEQIKSGVATQDAQNKLSAALATGQLDIQTQQLLGDLAQSQAGFDLNTAIKNGEFDLAAQTLTEAIRSATSGEALAGAEIGAELLEGQTTATGRAAALAPQTLQLGMIPSTILGQVGQEQFAYEQAKLDVAREQWEFNRDAPFESLNRLASLIGVSGGVPTGSVVSGPSTAQRLVQGAGAGLGTYAMMAGTPALAAAAPYAAGAMMLMSMFG